MGRNIRPYDLLRAARRDPRQFHLDAHRLSASLPAAVKAHEAAIPDARLNTKTVLAGTYQGPAQQTLRHVESLVAEAKELGGTAKWQVIGLRDGMDTLDNPMGYPACEEDHKQPVQKEFEL